MSTDYFGTSAQEIMDRSQIFPHWYTHTGNAPEVLLKIPTSAISSARIPRPLGDSLSVGVEPFADFYPSAGSGGARQFMGSTATWVIPLKK